MSDPAAELASIWSLCLASAGPVEPASAWAAWSLAPATAIPLVAYGAIYAVGRMRTVAPGAPARPIRLEAWATIAALTLLVVALASPLCRLSAALAWVHMLQHFILVAVAPPLVILGAPARALEAALHGWNRLPPGWPFTRLRAPPLLLAAAIYGIVIWCWHIPAAYELALTGPILHAAYLSSLLFAGLWFWTCIIRTTSFGAAALALLATMVHTGLLGALLTFASWPLYPLMSPGAIAWGLSPIEDQQLAGLIMWVPMGMVYLVSALLVIGRGLGSEPVASAVLRQP